MTHFNKCAVNAHRNVFKVVLSSLLFSTVSVPPVNLVKFTTLPIYQYKNPAFKHAIVFKLVFCTSHVNTSPAPVVIYLNSSLPLHT